MHESNESIFRNIKHIIAIHNRKARRLCIPQYAVNIVMQDDKLHVCRSRKCVKNKKRIKCTLQNSGGNIEAGESPERAAFRELREETWNDLPDEVKSEYDFPVLQYTQKIYFGRETVIFIHKVPSDHKLYTGEVPAPIEEKEGAGEIDMLALISIDDVYSTLSTDYNGDKWRRCSVWSFKRLRPIIELYAQLS